MGRETESTGEIVDERPDKANAQAFSPHTMGDPQVEYGVVDLSNQYPATDQMWQPEYPMDAPKERHLVVPFEVVARGYTKRGTAENTAERLEEEQGGEYRVVVLTDTRGL